MNRSGGYSGLVATAEAIKQKAWKLLTYYGDLHKDQFFSDFPDSRAIYETLSATLNCHYLQENKK